MPSDAHDPIEVALTVARALDAVGAPYFLGGSLASSFQGEPRATNDIDFVVDLREAQVSALALALGPDFDVDEGALRDAVASRGSWNIFYLPLVTKIDLFIVGRSPFDVSEFLRRRLLVVRSDGASIVIKSPEDSILRKLRWYLDGGRVSEKQWRDVLQILKVNGASLDDAYLTRWASDLGVVDELERAKREAPLS